MNDQKYRMRVCMLYDFKQGKTRKICHEGLCKAFGDNVISYHQCCHWFSRFETGNESLEDEEHGHRKQIIDHGMLQQAIELDPTQTTRELAVAFSCSHTTIEQHLHAIGKVNRCGKWVPHNLSNANKATRVTIAGILLRRTKNSGFFDSILTSDEKWICYDNTTKKRQWLSPGEQPKTTPIPDPHGAKVMLCVWWSSKGLVYFEVLESGLTVTADLYQAQLSRVDEALRRQGVDTAKTKFLQDNARPHTAKITQQKIEELGWKLLPHPPYSPDIAPSDYHLFRSMQHSLADKKFKNREEVQIWVANFFESQPAEFFKKGIHSLRGRWQQVIDNNGEYLIE